MIVVITKEMIPQAKAVMDQYNAKLVYSRVYSGGECFYALSEGPLGALLTIRANIAREADQRRFGLS